MPLPDKFTDTLLCPAASVGSVILPEIFGVFNLICPRSFVTSAVTVTDIGIGSG